VIFLLCLVLLLILVNRPGRSCELCQSLKKGCVAIDVEKKKSGKRKRRDDEEAESEVKKGKRKQVNNEELEWREEMRKRFDKIDGVLADIGKRLVLMEGKLMILSRGEDVEVSESEESEEEEKEVEDNMQVE